MARFSALEIANFFIQLTNSIPDDSIDNMKLNKILYYAQGRSLVTLGHSLFDEKIEAWDYGPVVRTVYNAFKCCGKNAINEPTEYFDESKLTADELEVLTDVYINYGKYTGLALKEMTHRRGTPWDQVYVKGENNVIDNENIRTYFLTQNDFEVLKLNESDENVVTVVPEAWDKAV